MLRIETLGKDVKYVQKYHITRTKQYFQKC